MAPLPAHNTPRAYIDYTSGGVPHTLVLRFPVGTAPETTLEDRNDIVEAMQALMDTSDAVTGHRWSLAGTNVSNPIAGLTGAGAASGSTINNATRTAFISTTGRSTDGRDVKATVFLVNVAGKTTNRSPFSSLTTLEQNLISAIHAADLVTISDASVVWNSYANTRRNSYWQRQLS